MQQARGFIFGCANRVTLISWEAEHTEQQIGQAFYRQKPRCQHITYGLQSDWLQHYLYHISTSGDKRDPDVCSDLFLEKPQFCNFYGKFRCLCSSRKPHTVSFSRYHPSLFCKFHMSRDGGENFIGLFLQKKRVHVDRHTSRLRERAAESRSRGSFNYFNEAFLPGFLWPIIFVCLVHCPNLLYLRILPGVHTPPLLAKMDCTEKAHG